MGGAGTEAARGGRDADLPERLATWLGPLLVGASDAAVRIEGLTRLSGGASRQTWSFDVVVDGGDGSGGPSARRVPLILQRARRGSLTGSLEGEAALLRSAAAAGVAVPGVVAATDDEAVIGGRAVVTERLAGEAVARRLLRDDRYAHAREVLVGQLAEALAAVHRLDPTSAPHLRHDEPVAQLAALHAATGQARPVFEVALRWLADHRPVEVAPAVVHGDLRLGNLLVDESGLRAVLDWELAHLGDPAEDLAWACVKAWRFGSAQPVLGTGSVGAWLEAYAAAGGAPPDPSRLRWWLVLGTLRWGVICELQVGQHLRGATRSVELAAIGRRVCETEHDLLDLLGVLGAEDLGSPPVVPAVPVDGGPPGPPHAAPSTLGLVDAVAAFLADDVVGDESASGRVRFHARVAANVLAMVARELQVGADQLVDHRARLAELGVADDAALAAGIADGRIDLDDVGLRRHLVASVVDQLVVANPGYLATPPADPWR